MNQRTTITRGTRERKNSKSKRVWKEVLMMLLSIVSLTNKGGRMKPIAVPTMTATDRNAKAKDLWVLSKVLIRG